MTGQHDDVNAGYIFRINYVKHQLINFLCRGKTEICTLNTVELRQ